MELMPHQKKALKDLDNGKILYGGVGSGKTIASLAYYVDKESPKDIYVITTARKRDDRDWVGEASLFGIGEERGLTLHGTITVDSWANVKKYTDVQDAFFIFDEQKLVGNGVWVKSFYKIVKSNNWIILSGTPGDNWIDYIPVFVANGFYRNKTDFEFKHVLYEPFSKYRKIRGYLGESKLELLRNHILVEMPYERHTTRVLNWYDVDHNKDNFTKAHKDRWNIFEDKPIKDVSELFRVMRKIVNTDPSRLEKIRELCRTNERVIVFYNFDYELDILRELKDQVDVFEWNGHKHERVPDDGRWVYLVQYIAGAEAWNCVSTNLMVFYSMTYSYKNFEQAQGRIDRLNTSYIDLYYYIFVSNSFIDLSIKRALEQKRDFNERKEFGVML